MPEGVGNGAPAIDASRRRDHHRAERLGRPRDARRKILVENAVRVFRLN
jgi:hypothetical protein